MTVALIPFDRLSMSARAAVAHAADQLRAIEPTPLCGEAALVHDLRAARCLIGWRYTRADIEARSIVVAALGRLGVERPNWQDGQPLLLPGATFQCRICGAPLYDDLAYCSEACRRVAHNEHNKRARDIEAGRIAKPDVGDRGMLGKYIRPPESGPGADGQRCAICGAPFEVRRQGQKFCGHRCQVIDRGRRKSAERAAKKRAALVDLACEICAGAIETVKTGTKYCSHACRLVAMDRSAPIRECKCCSKKFQRYQRPSRPPPRFCSNSCQAAFNLEVHKIGKLRWLRAGSAETRGDAGGYVGRGGRKGGA